MAVSRIASQDAIASGGASVNISYPGATTAGNLLIAAVSCNNNVGSSALSGGGTWTTALDQTIGGFYSVTLFYKLASGSETTMTATCTSATQSVVDIFEYTGNANPIQIDVSAAGHDGGASTIFSVPTATISTANANDLIFQVAGTNGGGTSHHWTTATLIGSNIASQNLFCGENIVSATQSSYSDTMSWSSFKEFASTIIVAFQAASTPAATPLSFIAPPWLMVTR